MSLDTQLDVGGHKNDILVDYTEENCEKLVRDLTVKFPTKHLGELTWCAGYAIEREWTRGTLTISQETYVDRILERFDITIVAFTPESFSTSPTVEKEKETKEDFLYREAVGSLMWLATNISPITDAVRAVARHNHDPTAEDWRKVLRILAHLNGSRELGITYECSATSPLLAFAQLVLCRFE